MNSSIPSGCSRGYTWCISEATVQSLDGSPAVFHHGRRAVVRAGDDELGCALVASEDARAPYVQLELISQGVTAPPVWLNSDEADSLASELGEAARAVTAARGRG